VIFTLGGNKAFFFLCNGIEFMKHLSPQASFEVLTVVMMKISIFRDMTSCGFGSQVTLYMLMKIYVFGDNDAM